MRVLLIAVTMFLTPSLLGCAEFMASVILQDIRLKEEMWDVLKLKEEGTAKVYEVAPDRAWEIAKTVFHWEDADPIEEHRDSGYMLARKMGSSDLGTVMGAWIDQVDNGTKVTVVKRRIKWKERIAFSESTFHRRFARAVEIVNKGEPLPDLPPD